MSTMGLFYEEFTILSGLNQKTIPTKTEELIEGKRRTNTIKLVNIFKKRKEHKPFWGETDGHKFKIQKIVHYKNSFLPTVEGKIEGNMIHICMKLGARIKIFLAIWTLFVLGLSGYTYLYPGTGDTAQDAIYMLIIIPVMLIIGVVSFKTETRKQKKLLIEHFQGTTMGDM